ncbi:hypothetical protein [Psychrobacillus lasiicapitis]|uniref:Lipoprotein n=1 Tax=Psychrobacillus lasiicapitis TaxID=1636719 RepID=A0A544TI35_9BACI|nr:hypothetical protein [Psychrobacillus lasiicapitis]TQR17116.1 hypothetical protein FG382_02935 [Psychrobacillus lasiicapitis]GGA24366.1 hypothetical protein GCM10011384_11920 [Psychrobacillus lasiicapitis]
MKRCLWIFVFIFFIIGCQLNENIDLKPPHPNITVDNQEISYVMGTYSWSEDGEIVHADSASPAELVDKLEANEVLGGKTISINFDYKPSSIEFGIWENNGVDLKRSPTHELTLPEEEGEFIFVIHASWDEGDGIYTFRIKTEV